jgi:sugar/nucleoside kinase (ribokinase family)
LVNKISFFYNIIGDTKMKNIMIYGIGNPLIDTLINADDAVLKEFSLNKGTMNLIDKEKREVILNKLEYEHKTYMCAGSCANTIFTTSGLAVKSAFSGKIADDKFARMYEDKLTVYNVVNDIKIGKGITGSCISLFSEDNARTLCTYPGIAQEFSEDDVNENHIKNSEYLYFTGYMWNTESQKNALKKAINIAKKEDTKIILDIADKKVITKNKPAFLNLIKNDIDIVIANEKEAAGLFDNENPEENIVKLNSICDIAVITSGTKGSLVKEKDKDYIKINAYKVKTRDVTGAGDAYTAGFMYGLVKNWEIKKACMFASYLASQIVLQVGTQFSFEKLKDIKYLIELDTWYD